MQIPTCLSRVNNCNGDYADLKKAVDPDDTSGSTLLDGSRHPCYSLENRNVNAEFIFIVDTQNIPQFFDHILGHPDLIDLQTQEQKKETWQKWYFKGIGKEYHQQYNQQRKLSAAAQDFTNFSTSGVLPESLQCDCGKKYNIDSLFQNHIAACPHIKKGLRSSQQLLIKSLGMSATSCKDHRIRWLELKSELKAMHLPPSDLDVNSFIKKDQQPRVNSFIKEQQQERVD